MSRIVLVHGSCHGAWCWAKVIPHLTAAGHEVAALDMPGRGEHPVPLETATLDDFAQSVLGAAADGAALVGHSAGGFAITAAAQRAPEKVHRLIYVCGFVPEPGRSLADMRRMMRDPPLAGAIRRNESGLGYSVDPGLAPAVFYSDLPPGIAAEATARLCAEPIAPQETPLPDTARAETLPRRYILCEADRTILPEMQERMIADWPDAHVARMPTGHSPFLADPEGLARHILAALET